MTEIQWRQQQGSRPRARQFPDTVKFHIDALFGKLDVKSRAEAVANGMRWWIVEF